MAGGSDAMELLLKVQDPVDLMAGGLHVLVNNAAPMEVAGPSGQLFEEVLLKNWEEMLRTFIGSRRRMRSIRATYFTMVRRIRDGKSQL